LEIHKIRDMKAKLKKPSLLKCMDCKHYGGQHKLLTKVVCEWKPTSDTLHHRNVNPDGTVNCPKLLWGIDWKDEIMPAGHYRTPKRYHYQ
jgi:hypothetical protein